MRAHACARTDTAKFLNDLKTYDRDNINERVILEVAPFMEMAEFQPEVIDRASKACSGICMWVRAMYKYYYVAKMVRAARAGGGGRGAGGGGRGEGGRGGWAAGCAPPLSPWPAPGACGRVQRARACRGAGGSSCAGTHAPMRPCTHSRTQVEPKKKKLVEAQERLDRTMADLNVAKQRLRDVLDRIADLEDQFTATQMHRERLGRDVDMCRMRLERARKLIGGLGGEKQRWADSVMQVRVGGGRGVVVWCLRLGRGMVGGKG